MPKEVSGAPLETSRRPPLSHHLSRSRSAVAALLSLTALLLAAPAANAEMRWFKPVRVTPRTIAFKVRGVDAGRIEGAQVRLGPRRYKVSTRRIRRVVRMRRLVRVRTPRALRQAARRHARSRSRLRVMITRAARRRPPKLGVETSSGTTDGSGTAPTAGCGSAPGSFGAGAWPSGCWRPYADSSPFNQELPASPQLHPNSAGIVRRVESWGGWFSDMYAGAADTSSDYEHPIYYARSSDPVYTLQRAPGGYGSDYWGVKVRIPQQARAASGGDGHLDVVQPDGTEWGLWKVSDAQGNKVTRLPAGGGTVYARGLGKSDVGGSGLNVGSGDANAGRWGLLGGIIRAQEMEAGQINHALYMYVKCDSGEIVYPASGHGGRCSDPTNAPAEGTRFQLAMSGAQIDALGVPGWKKTILRAMARYGVFVGDTGGSPLDVQFESGSTYTSFGYQDEMVSFATAHKGEGGIAESGGRYYFDLAGGVDWARYLRVVDPCVSQRSC